MAYTPVLEAGAEKHTGSSPVTGTRITESWLSGLKQQVANLSWHNTHRWFKSNTLRHIKETIRMVRKLVGNEWPFTGLQVRVLSSPPDYNTDKAKARRCDTKWTS